MLYLDGPGEAVAPRCKPVPPLSPTAAGAKPLTDIMGSLAYMAPEVLGGKGYGSAVDVWSGTPGLAPQACCVWHEKLWEPRLGSRSTWRRVQAYSVACAAGWGIRCMLKDAGSKGTPPGWMQVPSSCRDGRGSSQNADLWLWPCFVRMWTVGVLLYLLLMFLWTAGVLLYVLLIGGPPFWAKTEAALIKAIREEPVRFSRSIPLSDEAQQLMLRMLTRDPLRRITAEEALREFQGPPRETLGAESEPFCHVLKCMVLHTTLTIASYLCFSLPCRTPLDSIGGHLRRRAHAPVCIA